MVALSLFRLPSACALTLRHVFGALFAAGLKKWLSLFHVHYRPEVHDALAALGSSGRADVTFESVKKRYAYIASLTKR